MIYQDLFIAKSSAMILINNNLSAHHIFMININPQSIIFKLSLKHNYIYKNIKLNKN